MTVERPNPDELLARVQAAEFQGRRGKLKIFFGYAAGVGKTYAMLMAARQQRAAGVEVVVGYVEPHGRPETEALLEGLEILPPRLVPYRGVTLRELDLDAALARRSRLMLVDELAHTNAEDSRHTKRWQDIEELLDAGIDIYTTLNVQHVESLNDVIAQITGVVVKETLPDSVLERADEIELIDLTPDELIERLRAGKVYVPAQAERALARFFQKSNLLALREISLRQTAQRLRREVEAAREEASAQSPWATNERLLVCVGPSPTTTRLIRTAKRMATAFGAEWLAVAVAGESGRRSTGIGERIAAHLRLAEQLGGETHTLSGTNVADAILDYARTRNVTKILVGKTAQPRWRRVFRRTVVDALLERSGEIDVYVIRGEGDAPRHTRPRATRDAAIDWDAYLRAAAAVAFCGLLGGLGDALDVAEANIVMIFLLGVAFVSTRHGRGPSIAAAIASVLVFDFFFVPPRLTFAVSDTQYVLTFAVMLAIGLIISTLTSRLKDQFLAAKGQERRTAALYRLTRQLGEVSGTEFLCQAAGRQLGEIFEGDVALYIRESGGSLQLRFGERTSIAEHAVNGVVAGWVADHGQIAGEGTDTLPNATAYFAPLVGSQRTVGAVGVKPRDAQRFLDPEQRRLLETCASLIALSIERDEWLLEAHQAQLQVQAEQLRNSLLSSVSHDLRTPLAAIEGAGSTLLDGAADASAEARVELLRSIVEESRRLTRLVDNLLDMTRLESGTAVRRQWHVLEEQVGSALGRLKRELAGRGVRIEIPHDLPLVFVDGILLEQLLFNLLDNAVRHTPPDSAIEISARALGHGVELAIRDAGPGLPPACESKVFDKFFRGAASPPDGRRGVGLGLTICRAIVEAHGGRITAANLPGGGAEFVVSLPSVEPPPSVPREEIAAGVA